jgi:putative ubiquitin-RnfH superfamily antitoxin RatB of RatAB toxin-antitoxin module
MAAIRVEVVYAIRGGVDAVTLELPAGATVRDALVAARMNERGAALGIFGRRVAPETALADGDRVEIYRPLLADAKEQRRRRAKARRR